MFSTEVCAFSETHPNSSTWLANVPSFLALYATNGKKMPPFFPFLHILGERKESAPEEFGPTGCFKCETWTRLRASSLVPASETVFYKNHWNWVWFPEISRGEWPCFKRIIKQEECKMPWFFVPVQYYVNKSLEFIDVLWGRWKHQSSTGKTIEFSIMKW